MTTGVADYDTLTGDWLDTQDGKALHVQEHVSITADLERTRQQAELASAAY